MAYEHKDYSHEPWANESWVLPLLKCSNVDKQFVGGTPANGANYFYANRALDLYKITREELNAIWLKYSGMITYDDDQVKLQRLESIRLAELRRVRELDIKRIEEEEGFPLHSGNEDFPLYNGNQSISGLPISITSGIGNLPLGDGSGHQEDGTIHTYCGKSIEDLEVKEKRKTIYDFHDYDLSLFKDMLFHKPIRGEEYKKGKYKLPESPIPMGLLELYPPQYLRVKTDTGVNLIHVTVPSGLETTLEKAWESPEWQQHTLVSSGRTTNRKKFIERTMFLFDHWLTTGKMTNRVIRGVCGDDYDEAEKYLELIQMEYTSKTKKLKLHILDYDRGGKGSKGGKAKWDTFLTGQTHITQTISTKSVVTGYKRYIKLKYTDMMSNLILRTEYVNYKELTPPPRELVVGVIDFLVNGNYKHKGQLLTRELGDEWIDNFDRNKELTYTFYTSSLDRHYGSYIFLPSEIRKLFKWGTKKLSWLDYSSMHPTLLMMLYMRTQVGSPNHEAECVLIREILGMDRDYISLPEWNPRDVLLAHAQRLGMTKITADNIKVENLVYYNMKQCDVYKTNIDKLYKRILPGFREWLAQIKCRTPMGNESVSKWLLTEESNLMEEVMKKLWKAGIFALGAHDGADVDPDKGWQAEQIFRQVCVNHNLPPNITLK